LPLTGDYADTGQQVKEGMELAAAQVGLNLVIKDCQNDAAAAAKVVEELAQDKNLKVLVGPMTSATAEAAAQAAQRLNIPIITLTQKKDITAIGPMVFRDFLTGRKQVKALIEYNARKLNLRRYGVLYPESAYGQTFLRLFDEELATQGGLLVSQVAYPEGGQDVAEAIATLARTYRPHPDASVAFDALFIPDDARAVLKLASELAGSPLAGVRLVGTNLMYSPKVGSQAPTALQGLLFPEAFFVDDPDPEIKAFVEAYKNKYSKIPHYLAAQGYSSIKLAHELLKKMPDASREDLARALVDLRPVSGVPLFRGFNAEREAELNINILTIQDGQMKIAQ
jgi:ABC-type branched-subunit amino acid transport system substrate-binding protein